MLLKMPPALCQYGLNFEAETDSNACIMIWITYHV